MFRTSQFRLLIAAGLAAVWLAGVTTASQRSASAMASAANAFLAGLTPEQRGKAAMPLDSEDRTHWNFIPTSMFARKGLPLKEMTEPQRALAQNLLKAGLSDKGVTTVNQIRSLENVLKAMENGRGPVRDDELYFFSIFGTPSNKAPWAWRVEGHHLSLHFTIAGGATVVSAPTFFGSNPAEVREGDKKGLRVLGAFEDTARALLGALDAAQQKQAIMADVAPNEILSKTTVELEPFETSGVAYKDLNDQQRGLLMAIVDAYTSEMTADTAAERMDKIKKAGLDAIAFTWAGPTEKGAKHYYRVQGPTFLVEYDNSQNDGNHVHSVWRDFNGDFGRDLLREHVNGVPH
jgi:Protein of unknown function (DUF3500)